MEIASIKPIVHYTGKGSVQVGSVAYLTGVTDHPVLGDVGDVRTSTVLSYYPATGQIETLNTVYRPA